jgi:protein-arginine deiminase
LRFLGHYSLSGDPWTGTVQLSYSVADGSGSPLGDDAAKIRVAPWILFGNVPHVFDTIYASEASSAFINDVKPVVENAGLSFVGIPWSGLSGWSDQWVEDWFMTGYTAIPAPGGAVQGMRIALPRPYSYGGTPLDWLEAYYQGPDRAALQVYTPAHEGQGTSFDSYGNHDLIPPYTNGSDSYPLGRIIYGYPQGVLDETEAFYEAQLVQAPALTLDTNWLAVGHIDEVFSYVPASTSLGWKLVVSGPALMTTLLEGWQNDGDGSEVFFFGKSTAVDIDGMLSDADMQSWNQYSQAKIDDMVDSMTIAVGLQTDDIVVLPLYYEDLGGNSMLAFHPSSVNSMVFQDHFVSAKQFAPDLGSGDCMQFDVNQRLGASANVGSTGQGMIVSYVDDWSTYHMLMGEVHCGTNQDGPPPTDAWWEVER